MNYRSDIDRSIEFMEMNIRREMTAMEIAGAAGYSGFHFSRLFARYRGIPLMNYVRKRRLSLARMELLKERKIIDVAMEFGFETAGGFTRAFRREYGYTPSKYTARMRSFEANQAGTGNSITGGSMEPTIIKKPAFRVAGYGIRTNIEGNYTRDIAAWWSAYSGESLETRMYEQLNPPRHGEIGICIVSPEETHVTYLLGVIVEDFSNITPEMITIEVPEATYGAFTTAPVDTTINSTYENGKFPEAIRKTWQYIFEEWFPNSEYIFDEGKLDFEFYDERCHFRPDSVMEIYVPVKPK